MIPHAPILAIVLPLFTAFVMPVIGILAERYHIKHLREAVAIAVMVAVLIMVGSIAPDVWGGEIIVYKLGGWPPPWGIVLAVDALSTQMALMIALLGTLVVIYSASYMGRDSGLSYFYTLILLVMSGMLGIVLTGDFFNFYVFLEIMSISSYALVSFRRDALSIEAGMKYLVIGSLGTSFVLLSVVMLYGAVGSLNIADLAIKLAAYGATNVPPVLVISLALFVTGVMVKVAMVPFHTWLPDAFTAAPTAISALLAGPAAVVGIYWVARLPYLPFGMPVGAILVALGLISMVVGVLMALMQRDFKRMLAYHVISQKGYMVLGIGLGTLGAAYGTMGGLFHLLNHSTYKALLFMCAGAVLYQTKSQKFDELGGLGKNMPITAITFLIGALAISGIPPLNGFVSKYLIYLAGLQAGMPWITAIAVVVSGLTLASFMKAFSSVFLGQRPQRLQGTMEAPKPMLFSMIVMALICVAIGLIPDLGFNIVGPAAEAAKNVTHYISQVLGGT
ncbi:MAG: proton-conducting transporter membrane subunit [Candidatus Hadarchaeum sp.]|uniref:proton-conducting transporter transmembrane domain-containing protein n=1 Tax=Candidatus Hadarchaeum sp. TaxID=2883567 RepID=UPI003D1104DB